MTIFHVLLICILGLLCGNVSAACPEGFERHGSGCYKVLELNASWPEAKVYCSVLGGDLAQIEDAGENSLILGMISRLHDYMRQSYSSRRILDEYYKGEMQSPIWLSRTHITHEVATEYFDSNGSTVSKSDEFFWVDGSDMLSENEWRWMGQKGTSQPMMFTDWRPGQPDNAGGTEHCLEIVNDHWNDDHCENKRSFICEARDIPGNTDIVG